MSREINRRAVTELVLWLVVALAVGLVGVGWLALAELAWGGF